MTKRISQRTSYLTVYPWFCAVLMIFSGSAALAQTDAAAAADVDKSQEQKAQNTSGNNIEGLQKDIAAQQKQLKEQQAGLDAEKNSAAETAATIAALKALLDAQDKKLKQQQEQINRQQESLSAQSGLLQSMQTQVDQLASAAGQEREPTSEELAMKERLASLETQVKAIPEDPSLAMQSDGFPGSIRIPGTDAAIKIGGFVKFNFVKSFDPVGSKDRFIVGSIPVGQTAQDTGSDTSLTANQSRVNIDARENTSLGQFRAFVEGDFAGSGDTFRLRHAYGQFKHVLAGKTWSAFYDAEAAPEEIDFEGLSGRVILRQPQVRYFPQIAPDWNLVVSLEDPVSETTDICYDPAGCTDSSGNSFMPGGTAIPENESELPDMAMSVQRTWFNRWHVKTALVLRRISAQSVFRPASTESTTGFGINMSGTIKWAWLDPRDNFKFQLIAGEGIGRYINDSNSVGGLDAVFAPDGSLNALKIGGGYVSAQHWWSDNMRSTAVFTGVFVDNYNFEPGDAYNRVLRGSGNLLWSPIPRVDVGTEVLWGQRRNNDDQTGDAIQVQMSAKYRF
jgi:hypothetical protein